MDKKNDKYFNKHNIYFDNIDNLSNYINNKKVLIITDDNIPESYYSSLLNNEYFYLFVIHNGETSKSLETYASIIVKLNELSFSRHDLIISIGGGVVGDLAGFVASTYKRGIDWINVPTTTLAMIDSCYGGKTAINIDNIKNNVGTFYNPRLVLIDTALLSSLPTRHFNNGIVEALKMGYLFDEKLIDMIEKNYKENIEEIIRYALFYKIKVVKKDPHERQYRKILNFGHTFGHAFESAKLISSQLLHGEAVGLGMRYFINESLKSRLENDLNILGIDFNTQFSYKELEKYLVNDKKATLDFIDIIYVDKIGKPLIKKIKEDRLKKVLVGGNNV